MFTSKKHRAQQEIELRRGRLETYIEPLPIDTATDIPDFLSYFYRHILFQHNNSDTPGTIPYELQQYTHTTGKYYNELVLQQPQTITHEDFWQRYFYRTNSIERVIYEMEQIDDEKKKATSTIIRSTYSKFSWRSSSSNTNNTNNTNSSSSNMMDESNQNVQQQQQQQHQNTVVTSATTTSTKSLTDLIPQRVISTTSSTTTMKSPPITSTTTTSTATSSSCSNSSTTTRSSISNNIFAGKKTIFNDLLPKRKPRSSSTSLSPAVSKDIEDQDTGILSPSIITPIILDLHDDPDEEENMISKQTTTYDNEEDTTVSSKQQLETLLVNISEPTEEITYTDEYTEAIMMITSPGISHENMTNTNDDHTKNVIMNNVPNDNEIDRFVDIPQITSSSSSMEVVETVEDTVEVTPKLKFFTASPRNDGSTSTNVVPQQQVVLLLPETNGNPNMMMEHNDDDEKVIESIVTPTTTATTKSYNQTIKGITEQDDNDTIIIMIDDTATVKTSNIQEGQESMTDPVLHKNNASMKEMIQEEVTKKASVVVADSQPKTDNMILMQKMSEDAMNMLEDVTQLCCNSSMDNDDMIRPNNDDNDDDNTTTTTTNVMSTTDSIVATTTTIVQSDIVPGGSTMTPKMETPDPTTPSNTVEAHHTEKAILSLDSVIPTSSATTKSAPLDVVVEENIVPPVSTPSSNDIVVVESIVPTASNPPEYVIPADSIPLDVVVDPMIPTEEPTIVNGATGIETMVESILSTVIESIQMENSDASPSIIYDEDIVNGTASILNADNPSTESVVSPSPAEQLPNDDSTSIVTMETKQAGHVIKVNLTEFVDSSVSTVIPPDVDDNIKAETNLILREPILDSIIATAPSRSSTQETEQTEIIENPTALVPSAERNESIAPLAAFTDDDFLKAIQANNDAVTEDDFVPAPTIETVEAQLSLIAPLTIESEDLKARDSFAANPKLAPSLLQTDTPDVDVVVSAESSVSMKSVAALMVELPKRVPSDTEVSDLHQRTNHRFINPPESTVDQQLDTVIDTGFDVVNPFDDLLDARIKKIDPIAVFNETIDSMPLAPDEFQSWNISTDNSNINTHSKAVQGLLHDAFDPFAVPTPQGLHVTGERPPSLADDVAVNAPTISISTLAVEHLPNNSTIMEDNSQSTSAYVEKLIHEEFVIESALDSVVTGAKETAIKKVENCVSTAAVEPWVSLGSEIKSLVNDTAQEMVQVRDVLSFNKVKEDETDNDEESGSKGITEHAVDLERRMGNLFSSKKRKQSIDATVIPDILDGFPSPKMPRHSNSMESMLVQDEAYAKNIKEPPTTEGDGVTKRDGAVEFNPSKENKHEDSETPVESDSTMAQGEITVDWVERIAAVPKQVPVESGANREIRDDLKSFFKSISADDDQEAHLFEQMKSLEEAENEAAISNIPIAPPKGVADSRAATPVTSNVDLTALERSENDTSRNGATNGSVLGFRFISFVFIILFGLAAAVVAQQWPLIVTKTVPIINTLCGPVPPGWSSIDHLVHDEIVIAEAPYWLPTNNTNVKQNIFQIICGADRVRTVLKITPTKTNDVYFFELLDAAILNVTDDNNKKETILIKKQKIRSVNVSVDHIILTRPRGKIELFHPNWVKSYSTSNDNTATEHT